MGRRAVKQELSREKIMHVARDLFATQGYRQVSMRTIGRELGYSHGAIYYHFKEKAELFHAVIEEDFTMLNKLFDEVVNCHPSSDVKTTVEQIMLEFIRFGLENPHHYEIMFLINDPELIRYCHPMKTSCFDQFSKVVHEATKAGAEMEREDNSMPWLLFLSMHGFITHYIHSRRSFQEMEERAKEHVAFCCRGL